MTAPTLQPTAHRRAAPVRATARATAPRRPLTSRVAFGVLVGGLATCAVGYTAAAVAVVTGVVRSLG